MKTQTLAPPAKPHVPSVEPIDFDSFVEKFGEKDRKSIIRHLTAYEEKAGQDAARRWRRLACMLMTLAPSPARLLGQQGLQFYVPDGKYRKQVFALEILAPGGLAVYTENVLAEAARVGIFGKPRQEGDSTLYPIKGSDETLAIASLDGRTPDPGQIYKAMTGWNRKAICITLPAKSSTAQFDAVESICALAATHWQAEIAPV